MEVTLSSGITNFEFQNIDQKEKESKFAIKEVVGQKSEKESESEYISQNIEFDEYMFNYMFDYGSVSVFG